MLSPKMNSTKTVSQIRRKLLPHIQIISIIECDENFKNLFTYRLNKIFHDSGELSIVFENNAMNITRSIPSTTWFYQHTRNFTHIITYDVHSGVYEGV